MTIFRRPLPPQPLTMTQSIRWSLLSSSTSRRWRRRSVSYNSRDDSLRLSLSLSFLSPLGKRWRWRKKRRYFFLAERRRLWRKRRFKHLSNFKKDLNVGKEALEKGNNRALSYSVVLAAPGKNPTGMALLSGDNAFLHLHDNNKLPSA